MQSVPPPNHQASNSSLAFLAVIATLIGLIPTAYATYISNSIALFSDFLRCFAEFLAVLLAWLVLRKISKSDPAHYNYGFGKFEIIASLFVAGAMFISFLILAFLVQHRISQPVTLENTGFGLCVSALAVFANAGMAFHYYRHTKVNASPIVESQWKLFRAKTVASTVVVGSLLVALLPGGSTLASYSDSAGSAFVALFLLYSAYTILSDSMNDLVDRSVEEVFQLEILRILIKHEELYSGFQGIRSRRSGIKMHVDIMLEFDRSSKMEAVHQAIRTLQGDLDVVLPDSEINIIASPPPMTSGV